MRIRLLTAVIAAIVWIPQLAGAAVPVIDIGISSSAYETPIVLAEEFPTAFAWHNNDGFNHTATSDLDGLFDTSLIPNAGTQGVTVLTAGRFPYHCDIHPQMHGTLILPMKGPAFGIVGATSQLKWADGANMPTGFVVDVQARIGKKKFKTVLEDDPLAGAPFTPGKKGKYQFRVRVEDATTHDVAGFSPVLTVKVTSA